VKKAKHQSKIFRIFLLFVFFIHFSGCVSQDRKKKNEFRRIYLPENEIAFYIPNSWTVNQDHYFHFKSVGFAPNHLPASLEYRGLNFQAQNQKSKDLYAKGWYDAIAENYPEWKYEYKRKIENDPEGSFEFEGTYRVATDTYKRIGKLRFRNKQVHAVYFTGIDTDFDKVKKLFEQMDSKIEYAPNK